MKRYSIHSVAELLGISADAIRLYEKEGLVSPMRDESNGYRYYGNEQIHKIMGFICTGRLMWDCLRLRGCLGLTALRGLKLSLTG